MLIRNFYEYHQLKRFLRQQEVMMALIESDANVTATDKQHKTPRKRQVGTYLNTVRISPVEN